ncbi:putative GARP complex component [Xylaria venustula]|nr:putative GARP complex component [Xylaria venustula]
MQTSPKSRQASTASLIHLKSGYLDTATSERSATVFEPGQNAISTLLQPPIVRSGLEPHSFSPPSSLYNTPTTRDIPPVALTNIQHIEVAEFKPYISQVGALYEQLHRIKDSENEVRTKPERNSDTLLQGNTDFGSPDARSTRKGSITSITSMDIPFKRPFNRRGSGSLSWRSNYAAPPLAVIPSIYFDEHFHLENPRTFHVVSERSDIVPPDPTIQKASDENVTQPRKVLATNAILQEKLSWYMDVAEMHLIDSISTASVTFLSALNSLKELHWEATEFVEHISSLRKDLGLLNDSKVTGGLQLLQKQRRHHNLQQLHDAVQQLKRVVDAVGYSEFLVDKGDVEKALTELDAIELLMSGERDEISGTTASPKSRLRDLRGATLLQSVAGDLTILRCRIGKVFEAQVHSLLIDDLRRHVQSITIEEVLSRWEASSLRAKGGSARELSTFPAYMGMTDEFRTALSPNISGLYRSRSIATAILAYRELVLKEIRNIVRRPLPPSTEDAESVMSASTVGGGRSRPSQERSSILARNIRALNAEDAENLFSSIFIGVTETLRRVKTQSSILLGLACTSENTDTEDVAKAPVITELQEEIHNSFDVSDLLGHAVDVGFEKIIKILQVRSKQTINLPLASFLCYFTLNLLFANECEAISGRAGTSLKTVVNDHILSYITAYGDRENKILADGMSSDDWQDKDFTPRDNEILELVLQCSTSDPPEWTEMSKIWSLSREGAMSNVTKDSEVKDKARPATIDEEKFLLPSSAILCLEGISNFLRLIGGIPSMTPDITASLISYLQTFDSRCRQLILGAGSILSAGLRNISTTNLVVALQAVTFVATIVPYIHEFVRRHAPAGRPNANLVGEFDKVRRALQEHQDSIYEKLADIMASRARIHSKKAREIEWDSEKAENIRSYIVDLTGDTTKLYKALSKRRPAWVVAQVMAPVFTGYREQLGQVFKEATLKTEAGRDCMFCDIRYLSDKCGKVEGFSDLGESLLKIIEDKEI